MISKHSALKEFMFSSSRFKEQERKLLLSRVVQTLENPDLELLVQDAVTYIYLAEKEDTQYFLPLVTKYGSVPLLLFRTRAVVGTALLTLCHDLLV